jgi:hypothetical protein
LYKIDPTTGSTYSTVWQECIAGWPEGAASMAPGLILEGEFAPSADTATSCVTGENPR